MMTVNFLPGQCNIEEINKRKKGIQRKKLCQSFVVRNGKYERRKSEERERLKREKYLHRKMSYECKTRRSWLSEFWKKDGGREPRRARKNRQRRGRVGREGYGREWGD